MLVRELILYPRKCKVIILFIYLYSGKFEKKIKSHDEEIAKKSKFVQDIQAKLINAQRQLEKQK